MDFDFVCNTLTFSSLNKEVGKKIETICDEGGTIDQIIGNLNTFIDPEVWNAPESSDVELAIKAIKEDLETCRGVLKSYYNLLNNTNGKAIDSINTIQSSVTTTLNNYYNN